MGRQTKLTKELCDEICELVAKGNYIERVCNAVGITSSTYNMWKKRGKKGEEPYASFYERVTQSEAKGEIKHFGIIDDLAESGNWLCSAWILERKYPQRYGKRENLNLNTDKDFKIEIASVESPHLMGYEEKKLLEKDQEDE